MTSPSEVRGGNPAWCLTPVQLEHYNPVVQPKELEKTGTEDRAMKAFREKFSRLFIAIRVICVVGSLGCHAVEAVDIGKAVSHHFGWVVNVIQSSPTS